MKFLNKTKFVFNLILSSVFLFQWTLITIEKKRITQINFGKLNYVKCNNPEHSHPPLSGEKTSNELVKFFNLEGKNLFFDSKLHKLFYFSYESKLKKFTSFPALSLALLIPARGPPYFEV